MAIEIILLIVGFVVLIKGADFLVNGSSSIARKFGISNIAIGLTVVAFGTSAPELVVSIISATSGRSDASFGNVLGSSNFNLYFILGVAGLIFPLVVLRNTVKYEVPMSLAGVIILYFLVNDSLFGRDINILSRVDALILLVCFLGFMYYIYRTMNQNTGFIPIDSDAKEYKIPVAILLSVLGIGMLVGGGTLVVDNAVSIAQRFNLSERLIGLTILAAGTSLPELATSAVAAFKKNTDIAIGNVIGSNIFNVTFILGIAGLVHPISYNSVLNFDLVIIGIGTVVLLIFMFTINQRKLDRWEAFLLFMGYLTYMLYSIFNDQTV